MTTKLMQNSDLLKESVILSLRQEIMNACEVLIAKGYSRAEIVEVIYGEVALGTTETFLRARAFELRAMRRKEQRDLEVPSHD